jgi:FAD/FMN-containing dehydrogenase
MIDLSPMKGIRVDPAARIARAQPGLRLGEFDRETQAFGLATTLGVNTDTGIAGLTLGGGYGWLGGKFGLACDNLLSVDVVTAGWSSRALPRTRICFGGCGVQVPIWGSSHRSNIGCILLGRYSAAC